MREGRPQGNRTRIWKINGLSESKDAVAPHFLQQRTSLIISQISGTITTWAALLVSSLHVSFDIFLPVGQLLPSQVLRFFFKILFLFIFREGEGRERERERNTHVRERHQSVVTLMPPAGDLAHNPTCPDWGLNYNLSIHRPVLHPLSHTNQDLFLKITIFYFIYVTTVYIQ